MRQGGTEGERMRGWKEEGEREREREKARERDRERGQRRERERRESPRLIYDNSCHCRAYMTPWTIQCLVISSCRVVSRYDAAMQEPNTVPYALSRVIAESPVCTQTL